MGIIFHADDYGLTRGVTDSILHSVDCGIISRVSIIPNGHAFDYAIAEFKKRPGLRLSVHLNLLEGAPLAQDDDQLLCDADGYLHHSFQSLWIDYLRHGAQYRKRLRQQISAELSAQLAKVASALGPDAPLTVDSHQHLHMIPFVFDELVMLTDRFRIDSIRMPRERFFLHLEDPGAARNYLGPNIVKQLILNSLARVNEPKLRAAGVGCNDYMIGVLFTGRMSSGSVRKALARIDDTAGKTIEVLFHPGEAPESEARYWQRYPSLLRYYRSEDREFERRQTSDPWLASLVRTED